MKLPVTRLVRRILLASFAVLTALSVGGSVAADAVASATPRLAANIDGSAAAGSTITLTGWAVDYARPATPITIGVLDSAGSVHTAVANGPRPDVARVLKISGNHGYSITFTDPATTPGLHSYCIGIEDTGAPLSAITCSAPLYVTHNPIGHLDAARTSGGPSLLLQGWAADGDAPSAALLVHIYVDGRLSTYGSANLPRPDVNHYFALPGNHGFSIPVAGEQGTHQYCAYGINVGAGSNVLIGCLPVTLNHNPIGYQDALLLSGTPTVVHGWAFDPDNTQVSIYVDIYVDGSTFVAHVPTNVARPDVDRRFGLHGVTHGFSYNAPTLTGDHLYCAYGINIGAGANTRLTNCWRTIN